MSNGSKITLAVVIVIVLGALLYWYSASSGTSAPTPSVTAVATQTPVAVTTPVNPQSRTTIQEDLASVDAQFTALDQNVASVDSAMNDKPVTQVQ